MINAALPVANLDRMLWMADYPSHGASRFPDRLAIIADAGSLTYTELDKSSDRFAAYLAQRNLAPGTRIAYIGKNSELLFPVLFGCLRCGVVLVPINWRCAPEEIAFILKDSDSRLVIHDPEFLQSTVVAVAQVTEAPSLLPAWGDTGANLRQVLTDSGNLAQRARHDAPDSCALQVYTSGTTGHPKGVMLSHRALSIARHLELDSPDWADWNDDDVILSGMPNFHIGGLSWMLIGLLRSLTCVLTADATPTNLLQLTQRYGVTRTFLVPTVVRAVLEQVCASSAPRPRLKTIYYGAAAIDPDLLTRCLEVLGCAFAQFFGMSENSGSATFLAPALHDLNRPELLRSVGKALPGMTLEIRDADNRVLPARTAGEIWIHSPTMMIGYWNQPEATAAALVDGWYKSGDGGYLDENGFLFLTDRIKDMIISGGENIYPVEVEQAVRRHPAVRDVVVVGMPDPVWGESVVAVVEWHDGQSATLHELRAETGKYIAAYKLPKLLRGTGQLPRTATGKLQRSEIRRRIGEIVAPDGEPE